MMRYIALCVFFLGFGSVVEAKYHSQVGQDKYVHEQYFRNMKGGVFVDIGAHDGVTINNTYFFEKERNWNGMCIEPIPYMYKRLRQNRSCVCVEGAIAKEHKKASFLCFENNEFLSGLKDAYDPRHLKRIESREKDTQSPYHGTSRYIEVQCYTLNELLAKHHFSHVNFLSIDTEGNEFDILQSIDFSKYTIDVVVVEDNYQDKRFIPFMESKGFKFVRRLKHDLLFVNKNFRQSA